MEANQRAGIWWKESVQASLDNWWLCGWEYHGRMSKRLEAIQRVWNYMVLYSEDEHDNLFDTMPAVIFFAPSIQYDPKPKN